MHITTHKSWKSLVALFMSACLLLLSMPAIAYAGVEMTDQEAVNALVKEFGQTNMSSATKTPLIFPLEYDGETYTNVVSYMEAYSLKETGREVTVGYTAKPYTTSYQEWSTGSMVSKSYTGLDVDANIVRDYFKDNNEKPLNQLTGVSFRVGDASASLSKSIYIRVNSLTRSPQEVVDYSAQQFPFERIANGNTQAHVVSSLGEKNGTVVSLPNATGASTNGLYGTKSIAVTWSAAKTNEDGASAVFAIDSSRKTTVIRPNVGEGDAEYRLTAHIASVADSAVTKDLTYDITLPEFDGVTVPVQITEGATLSITDPVYKKAVASKYIEKVEGAPEGYDLYHITLHKSAADGKLDYSYVASKDGSITSNGKITVDGDTHDTEKIDLTPSTEDDSKLKSLRITSPAEESPAIVKNIEFDKDTYDYDVEVQGVKTLKFAADYFVEGETAKITSYYKTAANANKGTRTTTGAAITSTCYLPDAESESTIVVTVTAPSSSKLTSKTRQYRIHVKKTAASGPLSRITVAVPSTVDGEKNGVAGNNEGASEEVLSPAFVDGTRTIGSYTVNYYRDAVTVTPTAAKCTITVDGKAVVSGKASQTIQLEVGDNEIPILVTDASGNVTEYTLTVHRKEKMVLESVEVENGRINKEFGMAGSFWTNNGGFSSETKTLRMKFLTNEEAKDAKIVVKNGDDVYAGKADEFIDIPVGDSDRAMLYVYLDREVDGKIEEQAYILNMVRLAPTAPDGVESFLPAPGQFVNQSQYANVNGSLTGTSMVTLGSFGGNIVYRYDQPIENSDKNPYGIDFIVIGNAFTNADGTSAKSASEPGAVMVSEDGKTWYELAGSDYYDANTYHNVTVTYRNSDTNFQGASEVKWSDNLGGSGTIQPNSYHTQPYYPNPEVYGTFQQGVGKNESYTAERVSFTGTRTSDNGNPAFGYADTHAAGNYSGSPASNPRGSQAANPYVANHYSVYNGDGFDLDWAVDADGNPVKLRQISYVKIYNPWLSVDGASGEKSPEVQQVLRADSADRTVGVTEPLEKLEINGKAVSLNADQMDYDIDAEGAKSLNVTATAKASGSNIYVSNIRTESGEATGAFAATDKFRIIVQEGQKAPRIYMIRVKNADTPESNAALTSLVLHPADEAAVPDQNDTLRYTVPSNVEAVTFTPQTSYQRAHVTLGGRTLESGQKSAILPLKDGETTFDLTVTSANEKNETTYRVVIAREDVDTDTIEVSFDVLGDQAHYDAEKSQYTGEHTPQEWVRTIGVKVPKDATVKYITDLMLNNAGIDSKGDVTYISAIKGLSEFDNGPLSGWMYTVNGEVADEAYSNKTLSDGDEVVWFYTDDYTKEPNEPNEPKPIVQTAIRSSNVQLSKTHYTYNGKVKTPGIRVTAADGRVLKKDRDYTVTYASGRKNVGAYKVTVTGKGDYKGTIAKSFRIDPKGTGISKLSKGKKSIRVQWKSQKAKMSKSRITGYQIKYAQNSKFKRKSKVVTVKGYATRAKTIKKLKSRKTYYVKIRTYKKVGGKTYYSNWSTVKKIKTK